ncbi:MAG: tripartite tricarboxylate transporter substrate binding protein [Betaproteobacteria bacterium]|nr:MAG: tripartite tricarboxylate transporter substrate binding protein [Betaproteobacteria bacterium]
MKPNPVLNLSGVAAAMTLALLAAVASAQYPSRPIRLLVPNPPGGATDTIARVVSPRLGEALGQPVVVENRPGSNGNLSSELVARAAPDGYTLLLGQDSQIVISPHLYANMPVDTLKDLAPVATLVTTQMVLTCNPALPVKNLQEFLEYARRAKPPLAYASIGNGSQHHLTMEMLKGRAGIELVHVPYKGGGPATVALLAGEVPVMFGGNSVTGHIRAGKLRGLAVAGKKRSSTFPELPSLSEFFPGLEVTAWIGIFTATGVPAPVLSRLHGEINRLLSGTDMREKVHSVGGLEPFISTPEEFTALIRTEYAKYGEVVKAVGAKID